MKKEEREISVVIEYFLLSLGCTVDLRLRYVPYLILVMVEGGRIGGVNLPELIGTLRKWGTCQLVAIGCWVSYRSFTNKWPRPAHCTVIRDGGHVPCSPISAVAKIQAAPPALEKANRSNFCHLLEMVATLCHAVEASKRPRLSLAWAWATM